MQRSLKCIQLRGWNLFQMRTAQHQIQVAPIVTASIDTASVRPDLDPGQVLAHQLLNVTAMPIRKVKLLIHPTTQ